MTTNFGREIRENLRISRSEALNADARRQRSNPRLISILLNCPKSILEAVGFTTLRFATPNEMDDLIFSICDLAM